MGLPILPKASTVSVVGRLYVIYYLPPFLPPFEPFPLHLQATRVKVELPLIYTMSRASEDFLSSLHGLVGEQIKQLLLSEDPRDIKMGIDAGLKFLKDNSITATVDNSAPIAQIKDLLPTKDELEALMTMTPD
jgi:hypothetical protein